MPDQPDISVIVVNYRSAALTVEALEQAAASAGEGGPSLEEIVVDAASGGNDVELLREKRPQATVVPLEENRGFAAGNNAGIARATGRHLLLLNPDAFAQGDAIARLHRHLAANPAVGVAAPLLHNPDGTIQDNAHKRFPNLITLFIDYCAPLAFLVRGTRLDPHNVWRRKLDRPRRVAWASGAGLLVRSEAARAAGPLDERFFLYYEDTEWQRRIARAGWTIELVPDAVFVHLGSASTGTYPLASPAFLDSVERYYRRPRAAMAIVRFTGLVSLLSLRLARRVAPRVSRVVMLEAAFEELRVELARRRDA